MTYFSEQYEHFRFSLDKPDKAGLRLPQAGALHAIAAHFSHHSIGAPARMEPAIITMPTGSGKTAVIMASPFLLQASRVLVITPSRLVREQIAENFAQLNPLRALGTLNATVPAPSIQSVTKQIETEEDWNNLKAYDVVVGTPTSLSPTVTGGTQPPADLFDLILIDEAHHSSAKSWRSLLDAFPSAHRILFTATPFRRDKRELVGSFVYTYELAAAWRDGVFGEVQFQPIDSTEGRTDDESIAMSAKDQLLKDRADGLDHRLLIRSSSRQKAHALVGLYRDKLNLRVEAVLGNHSLAHAQRTIDKLRKGELDAIACVDMFGEGFDLPQLKVAALHAPHRSLAVTLQFIGRFARTTSDRLGKARFFALASDMMVERTALYQQGAAWDLMIPNLSAARIKREREIKEVLSTFVEPPREGGDAKDGDSPVAPVLTRNVSDVSLYSLRPYYHVKVFKAQDTVDLNKELEFPASMQVVYWRPSAKHESAVYVLRELSRPDWATTDHFDEVAHELVILIRDSRAKLVFVCSSRRTEMLYEHLAAILSPIGGQPLKSLSAPILNKALLDLDEPVFFNVGLANAVAANGTESYRVLMGSSAQDSIQRSDARSFRRGHWFCAGSSSGKRVTLGLSSASKIWSNTSDSIPSLVQWCHSLGRKLIDTRTPSTTSNFDLLDVGIEVDAIPPEVMFAQWPAEFFMQPFEASYQDASGTAKATLILDMDIDVVAADKATIEFTVEDDDGNSFPYMFKLNHARHVESIFSPEKLFVARGRVNTPFSVILNQYSPLFFTATFGVLDGPVWFAPRAIGKAPFAEEQFTVWDWDALGIDVTNETGAATSKGVSIHNGVEAQLILGNAEIIYFDHGSGEMADFVEISPRVDGESGDTLVRLYHCKGTKSVTPGGRVRDAYEVCGQAAKSLTWAARERLLAAMKRRLNRKRPSRYVRGDVDRAELLLGRGRRVILEVVVVQPGFSKAELQDKLGLLLAAASDYLVTGPCKLLSVIGSD